VLWEGFVAGTLYSLIALGFVLIFKASGVFNFAQGIMVVFAALTLGRVCTSRACRPGSGADRHHRCDGAAGAWGGALRDAESWSTSQTSSCSWRPSG
jgi:hypothetical protein